MREKRKKEKGRGRKFLTFSSMKRKKGKEQVQEKGGGGERGRGGGKKFSWMRLATFPFHLVSYRPAPEAGRENESGGEKKKERKEGKVKRGLASTKLYLTSSRTNEGGVRRGGKRKKKGS